MTAAELVAATASGDGIQRDRWGRPLIIPPTGAGKAKAYTRVTTLAGTLDDTTTLTRWKQRMTLLGLVDRPELIVSAKHVRDVKGHLDDLVEQAMEASGANAAATRGTEMHRLTELLDRGEPVGAIPAEHAHDLKAYERAMAGLERLAIERFVVLDDIQVAGTMDRLVRGRLTDGETVVADVKTGSIDFGACKMSMQLALYAHGTFYDSATGERTPLPGVSGQRGLIIHVPAGQGRASLHWIDLRPGWDMVSTAVAVRAWRKRYRHLMVPANVEAAEDNLTEAGLIGDPITARIRAASTQDELVALWRQYAATGWTAEHTAQAAARKADLTNNR